MIARQVEAKPNPSYHLTTEEIVSEQEMVLAAKGDLQKFKPVYTTYYPRIAAFVYQRVDDKDTAFEITAQVFYKALEKLHAWEPKENVPFGAWLFRIALNTLNEFFRKNKAQRTINLDTEGLTSLSLGIQEDGSNYPEDKLQAALQSLEPDELELIDMRYFENRSYKEISAITGLGESACKMRVYRVLDKMKKIIQTN